MKFAGQPARPRVGIPLVTLWGCAFTLALVLSTRADEDQAAAANPYAGIVERNMFALVPIPTNPPVDPTPPDPPIKITPNGIMDVFGQLEVIFKAAMPAKGKEAAHDQSYVMAEGERQDDIEVVKIDNKTAVITFINHGIKQDLALADTPNITAPAASPGGGVPMPRGGGPGGRGGFNGGNGPMNHPGPGGGPAGNFPNNNSPNASAGSNTSPDFGAPKTTGAGNATSTGTQASNLSPEEQIVNMEKQRAKWLDERNPAAAIIPQTPLGEKLLNSGDGSQAPSP